MMRPVIGLSALGAAVLALAGCETKGEALPLDVARSQPPKPLVEEQVRLAPESPFSAEPARVAGQRWVPTATEYRLPARAVRSVGAARGLEFHALAWDEPPYDRLLVRREADAPLVQREADVWQEFLEVR